VSEGITSVLSALGFLNPGLHLMQTLFISNLEQSSQLLRILLITTTLASLALGHSILATGGAQCANRWHRCDPHGKEGWIECSFDLQCPRLVEIMGYQWAGTIMGWLL
jgi:hypothetical protein